LIYRAANQSGAVVVVVPPTTLSVAAHGEKLRHANTRIVTIRRKTIRDNTSLCS